MKKKPLATKSKSVDWEYLSNGTDSDNMLFGSRFNTSFARSETNLDEMDAYRETNVCGRLLNNMKTKRNLRVRVKDIKLINEPGDWLVRHEVGTRFMFRAE